MERPAQQQFQPPCFRFLIFDDRYSQLHRYAPLRLYFTILFLLPHLPFTHETPPFTQVWAYFLGPHVEQRRKPVAELSRLPL